MRTIITTRRDLENWVYQHCGDNLDRNDVATIVAEILARTDCPWYGTDWSEFLESLPDSLLDMTTDEKD